MLGERNRVRSARVDPTTSRTGDIHGPWTWLFTVDDWRAAAHHHPHRAFLAMKVCALDVRAQTCPSNQVHSQRIIGVKPLIAVFAFIALGEGRTHGFHGGKVEQFAIGG